MYKYFTGIGSRETPLELQDTIDIIVIFLNDNGYKLRSGGAPGADSMFELKCKANMANIYLPWKGFNNNNSSLYEISSEALKLAEKYHPAWDKLSYAGKKLMARNCYQVLGYDLKTKSDLVVCWTKDGKATGGTGQAIRLAESLGIPVINLYNYKKALQEISDIVKPRSLF